MTLLNVLQKTRMATTTSDLIDYVGRHTRPNCRAQVWSAMMRLERNGLVVRIAKKGQKTKWLVTHH